MLVFYDFEVFKYDWMVVLIEPFKKKTTAIVNDPDQLKRFYERHKSDIWVGFNSRHYDQFILKSIVAGFNPKKINDWIIVQKQSGYTFSSLLNKIPLINYDVIPNPPISLKALEGMMGNNIKESDVDFNIDRKLTPAEIEKTIRYCTHDVEQTIEVFLERKNDFDSHMSLVTTFDLPLYDLGRTQAQLSAKILDCQKKPHDDEFEYMDALVDTLHIKKYKFVVDWFRNAPEDCTKEMKQKYSHAEREYKWAVTSSQKAKYREQMKKYNWKDPEAWRKYFYKRSLTVEICGVPHHFGWGGLHGAPETPVHRKGLLLHVDVNSFYPSIMIEYGLLTRNSRSPEKYKDIYDYRLKLKAEKKKKEQAPYKIVLNATFGICKDKFSQAYDPRNANAICVNGQLLLLDLLEHLEGHCELIQSNTDGLIIQIPDTDEDFDTIDDICYEWESRTRMGLGLDVLREIYQKDVNNYVWIDEEGEVERKGAYVKELTKLDNDLPIINKALVDFMVHGTPVEQTIGKATDLIDFQKIVKLSGKYEHVEHNGKPYSYKCYRVFASKRDNDGKILKCRSGSNPAKFGITPDHCFIENDDITKAKVTEHLDREWYINLAKDRLYQYGIREVS